MAPTTRRESRTFGAAPADAPGTLNLEMILDNFEQCACMLTVRRKHMAQNRDIVRANTLAQLRIRELEARVQSLEQELAENALEAARQNAHARRVEYALECVRVGWDTIARGLDEAGVPQREAPAAAVEFAPPPAFQPSAHVVIESAPTSRQFLARDCPAAPPIAEEDAAPASVTVRRPRRHSSAVPDAQEVQSIRDYEGIEVPPTQPEPVEPAGPEEPAGGEELVEPMEPIEPVEPVEPTASTASATPAAVSPATPPARTRNSPRTSQSPHDSPANTPSRKRSRASRESLDLGKDEPLGARRARKSVNYALPKLNTKMRKPGPPPQEGARRRKSTAPRSRTPRTGTESPEPAKSEPAEGVRSPASSLASLYADSTAPLAPGTPAPKGARRIPRRPLSENRPFVPVRKSSAAGADARALQEHSAQHMPGWASSLIHLPSPEPPRRRGRAAHAGIR